MIIPEVSVVSKSMLKIDEKIALQNLMESGLMPDGTCVPENSYANSFRNFKTGQANDIAYASKASEILKCNVTFSHVYGIRKGRTKDRTKNNDDNASPDQLPRPKWILLCAMLGAGYGEEGYKGEPVPANSYTGSGLSDEEYAKRATEVLGFTVTYSHVLNARGELDLPANLPPSSIPPGLEEKVEELKRKTELLEKGMELLKRQREEDRQSIKERHEALDEVWIDTDERMKKIENGQRQGKH